MKFLLLFLLLTTNALAIKGVYNSDPDKVPEQACKIDFDIKCPRDRTKTCSGVCSATYLGSGKLMTAKHCVKSLFQASNKRVTCPNGEVVKIKRSISSDDARFENPQDLGVVVLEKEMSIKGMPLVKGEEHFKKLMEKPENCYMAGYGLDNDGEHGELNVAQTKSVETEKVMRYNDFSFGNEKNQIQHFENYADHGDSGGTYYCEEGGKRYLVATLQGGTKGQKFSFAEKMLQAKNWVDFHLGHSLMVEKSYFEQVSA